MVLWQSCSKDRLVRVALKSSVLVFARSELFASKTESSLASNSPALAGSLSLLHSTVQTFSSLFMLHTLTQRSLSSQFGCDLRRRIGYLFSLSLLQSRTRGSRPYHGTVFFPLASATCLLVHCALSHSASDWRCRKQTV